MWLHPQCSFLAMKKSLSLEGVSVLLLVFQFSIFPSWQTPQFSLLVSDLGHDDNYKMQ